MGKFLIVAKADKLQEYKELAQTYNLGFEYNDFFMPKVLKDEKIQDDIIKRYMEAGVPEYCTMHGAFMDVIVFSYDSEIRAISRKRMEISMDIANRIGVKGVVFHTNTNPFLSSEKYIKRSVRMTTEYLEELLMKYPDINIYLENMFDTNPEFLQQVSEKLYIYPNYGVCLDYGHAAISGTPVSEWINTIGKYVKHVHINDNDLKNDLHLAVGSGEIDWQEFRKYYEKYFKECTILIETTEPENQEKSIQFLIKENILDIDDTDTRVKQLKKTLGNAKCNEGIAKTSYRENIWEELVMEKNNEAAQILLEKIFYYMTELLEAKEFSKTVILLTDLGSTIVNADRASFWFWDKQENKYWTLAAKGNGKITIPEGTGMVGKAILQDKAIVCNEPYKDKDFNDSVDKATGYVTKSILCIPVENTEGEVIGAFQAINKMNDDGTDAVFDEDDIKKMSLVAAFCEKSLESHLLQSEAMVDALTGLKNRYAFYEYYNTKLIKAAEDDHMSVVMCDIDHFKKVNDTYGHNSGDIVLKEAAKLFRNNIGVDDMVVRWGGEEFIFLLYGKDREAAKEFAEEVRKKIEEYEFVLEMDTIHVTMSFGTSEVDKNITTEQNVKMADDRLYEAKHTGRNKVV